MGRKYRGADGWIHYEGGRARPFSSKDPVRKDPVHQKRVAGAKKEMETEDKIAYACGAVILTSLLGGAMLAACILLGAAQKLLSWLWS